MDTMRYMVKRLLYGLIVIFGISVITFVIVRVIPSDPAMVYLGARPTPEQVEQLSEKMGLNDPLYIQYGNYIKSVVQGDFGESLLTHRPVIDDIKGYLPNTLEIIFLAMCFAIIVGIPLGVLSANWKGKIFDHLSRVVSIIGVSAPSFWIALVLQVIFFSVLGLLPVSGQLSIETEMMNPVADITGFKLLDAMLNQNFVVLKEMSLHYILPVFTLSLQPIGLITRMTRSNVLDIIEQDYIRLSKANGIGKIRILFHYTLKNAFNPILTVIGLMFAFSIIGAFFVEIIFNWPGIGNYAVTSILGMDYPAIMGVTILITLAYVIINMVTDIVQIWLDPRIGGQ